MEIDDSLLRFPCEFPIKAMGLADNDFDTLVVGLVRKHSSDLRENAVKSRVSNGGRYISVTVTIQAESREQLDRIYLDLTAEKRVLMAL
jgi:uncharacterized protein